MALAETLAEVAARVRNHRMSPAERREQRISLIMGLRSKDSTLSREKIKEYMEERDGAEVVATQG